MKTNYAFAPVSAACRWRLVNQKSYCQLLLFFLHFKLTLNSLKLIYFHCTVFHLQCQHTFRLSIPTLCGYLQINRQRLFALKIVKTIGYATKTNGFTTENQQKVADRSSDSRTGNYTASRETSENTAGRADNRITGNRTVDRACGSCTTGA